MKKVIVVLFSMVFTGQAMAVEQYCGDDLKIRSLFVQRDRDSGSWDQNTLLISLMDSAGNLVKCNNKANVYLPQDDSQYDRILSVSMAAFMAGKKVLVKVNDSNTLTDATKIAYVGLIADEAN